MKKIIKTKTVEYNVYQTSDGKEFSSEYEAKKHEDILNGDKKECSKCNGKGRVNGRYEKVQWNYGHNSKNMYKDEKCTFCDGKGYLEKKWV